MQPLVCPKCGNDSSQKGILFAQLEWNISPVIGVRKGEICIDSNRGNIENIDSLDKATVTNRPNATNDCAHYHCNACNWNWYEETAQDWSTHW